MEPVNRFFGYIYEIPKKMGARLAFGQEFAVNSANSAKKSKNIAASIPSSRLQKNIEVRKQELDYLDFLESARASLASKTTHWVVGLSQKAVTALGIKSRLPIPPTEVQAGEAQIQLGKALDSRDYHSIRDALNKGADPNKPVTLQSGSRMPMELAMARKDEALFELFMNYGASPITSSWVGKGKGSTNLLYALSHGTPRMVERLYKINKELSEYTYQVKTLVHRFNFPSLRKFDGLGRNISIQELKRSAGDFLKSKPDQGAVADSLNNVVTSPTDVSKAMSRIAKGEIAAFSLLLTTSLETDGGKIPHHYGLVIQGDFLIKCNRGWVAQKGLNPGDGPFPGLEIYTIGNKANLRNVLSQLVNTQTMDIAFEKDLDAALSLQLVARVPHQTQSRGNCSFAQSKLLLEAIYLLDLLNKGFSVEEATFLAYDFYKDFTTFDRSEAIDDFIRLMSVMPAEKLNPEILRALGYPTVTEIAKMLLKKAPERKRDALIELMKTRTDLFPEDTRKPLLYDFQKRELKAVLSELLNPASSSKERLNIAKKLIDTNIPLSEKQKERVYFFLNDHELEDSVINLLAEYGVLDPAALANKRMDTEAKIRAIELQVYEIGGVFDQKIGSLEEAEKKLLNAPEQKKEGLVVLWKDRGDKALCCTYINGEGAPVTFVTTNASISSLLSDLEEEFEKDNRITKYSRFFGKLPVGEESPYPPIIPGQVMFFKEDGNLYAWQLLRNGKAQEHNLSNASPTEFEKILQDMKEGQASLNLQNRLSEMESWIYSSDEEAQKYLSVYLHDGNIYAWRAETEGYRQFYVSQKVDGKWNQQLLTGSTENLNEVIESLKRGLLSAKIQLQMALTALEASGKYKVADASKTLSQVIAEKPVVSDFTYQVTKYGEERLVLHYKDQKTAEIKAETFRGNIDLLRAIEEITGYAFPSHSA